MIQRLQSLFLMAITGIMVGLPFFPIWIKIDTQTGYHYILKACTFRKLSQTDVVMELETFPYTIVAILATLVAVIAFYELFQYKHRLRQIRVGILNSWILAALIGLTCYLSVKLNGDVLPGIQGSYKVGFVLPAIAMVCNMIATRLIKRDEELVRSADRII